MNSETSILITGANGLIGHRIYHELRSRGFQNITLLSKNSIQVEAGSTVKFDFQEYAYLSQVLDMIAPKIIFNTAAISSIEGAIADPELTQKVNVLAVKELAEWSQANQAKLIHFSSDFVFDGTSLEFSEKDEAKPLSDYGKSKLEGDFQVMLNCTDFIIIRPIMVFGWNEAWQRKNIFTWVYDELKSGKPIMVTSDQIRMPTLVSDLVHNTVELALSTKTGLYHISGSENINVLDFANRIAEVFHFDEKLISAIKTSDLPAAQPRPLLSGFDLTKAKSLPELKFRSIESALNQLKLDLIK